MESKNGKKVLIVTALGGSGHISAAKALKYWLTEWGYESVIASVGSSTSDELYGLSLKSPRTYKSIYALSDRSSVSSVIVKGFSRLEEAKIMEVLTEYHDFDAVISTYPFFHPTKAKKSIITCLDPVVHSSWLAKPFADHYFMYWDESTEILPQEIVKRRDIVLTGPLVRASFYDVAKKLHSAGDKKEFKIQLGLDPDKRYCLVTAGGAWIGKSKKYIKHFETAFRNENMSFIFMCGKNKKFQEQMSRAYSGNSKFVFLPWKEEKEVAQYMAASDYIAMFTIAQISLEAGLALLPVYIFGYIDGQEHYHKKILTDRGVGVYLDGTIEEKVWEFKELVNNKKQNNITEEKLIAWQQHLLDSNRRYKEAIDRLV